MEKDEIDELIEQESIKEAGDAAANAGTGNSGETTTTTSSSAPASTSASAQPAAEKKEIGAPTAVIPTPKEILGLGEETTWDTVKASLSEMNDLRQKVQTAESQPKTAFANDKVAGFNEFLTKNPSVAEAANSYAIYESVLAAQPEDKLKVLTTKYILDNPRYAGKEELVGNILSKKYQLNVENLTPEEIAINNDQMEADAEVAFKAISGLRESLKTPSTTQPVNLEARHTEWKNSVQEELGNFTKLPVPIMNTATGKPELYVEIEIPKERVEAFAENYAKALSKVRNPTEADKRAIKVDFIKEELYENFATIAHAISTKSKADERLAVEAEYDGAGKLRADSKTATSTGQHEEDPYDKVFGGG